MNCPKCRDQMRANRYDTVEYNQCRNCGGLWFDALEAEELVEIKGAAAIDTGDPKSGSGRNKSRNVKCPVCSVSMLPVQDMKQPHIQLEACPSCRGTFFDAGEFKDFCEETIMDRVKDWFARKK